MGKLLTLTPNPVLEALLETTRGPNWDPRDYGNGLLPANSPRQSLTFKCNACGVEGPLAEIDTVHEVSDNLEVCEEAQLCPVCGSPDLVVFEEGETIVASGVAVNRMGDQPALRSISRPCWPKEQHASKAAALAQLRSITRRGLQRNQSLHAYRCTCLHPDTGAPAWHVGHRGGRR